MRKFHNKLSKTVYNEFKRAIKRLGLKKKQFKITKNPMKITYLKNGNSVYFTGNDSIDDTKGIIDEEKPIKLVILDELTEFFERGQGEDEISNIAFISMLIIEMFQKSGLVKSLFNQQWK